MMGKMYGFKSFRGDVSIFIELTSGAFRKMIKLRTCLLEA